MPTLRSILDRFRPAPAPGRPGPLGVPSEKRLSAADELAPVFAVVDSIDAECTALRAEGMQRADQIWRAAEERAAQIAADAAVRAQEERAATTAARRAAAHQQYVDDVAAAQRQADEIYTKGLAGLPPKVAAAVERVRALADGPAGEPALRKPALGEPALADPP
jgi:hypothetical protein